jgi:hypothetical protein
MEYKPKKK